MSGRSDEAYKRIQEVGDQVGKWLDRHVSKVIEGNAARVLILVLVGLIALQGLALLPVPDEELQWLGMVLKNVGPELAGIVFGVVAIDLLNERRQDEQLKAQLIRQMGMSIREVAVPAARELAHHGWLCDGAMIGVELRYADLSGANLGHADLSGADLRNADLSGARLLDANLSSADLLYADLGRANLTNANLSGADLFMVDLNGANLTNANLGGADLFMADLSEADLHRANLSRADLMEANLSGGQLLDTNLRGADLRHADLSRALLMDADLSGANLSGANLREADLDRVNLSRAHLMDVDLRGANLLYRVNLNGASLPLDFVINPANWKAVIIESRTLRWSRD